MPTPSFDLIDITQALSRRFRFLLLVAIVGALIAAALYLFVPRKYQAEADLLITNPLYTDRNNLFRNDKATFVDYYGREDDVDKVMAVAKSRATHDSIIRVASLWAKFGLDTNKNKFWLKDAEDRFMKGFEVKRTEYITVKLSYTDPDPKLAAMVCNDAAQVINQVYSGFYNDLRRENRKSIQQQYVRADSMVSVLTDSLANMRDRYGIYQVLSPTRITLNTAPATAKGAGYGMAMEKIQNIEAAKDQYVIDRTRYQSLLAEYSTAMHSGDQPQIQVISPAIIPEKPKGLNLPLTILVGGLLGGFFAMLWVLFATYWKKLSSAHQA